MCGSYAMDRHTRLSSHVHVPGETERCRMGCWGLLGLLSFWFGLQRETLRAAEGNPCVQSVTSLSSQRKPFEQHVEFAFRSFSFVP